MSDNPILAELIRGNTRENIYRGAIAVSDGSGKLVKSLGDVSRIIFPRSAVKSMQAIAMFKSGAIDKFNLSDKAITLACASHLGEPDHADCAGETLAHLGLSVDDLECGTHVPAGRAARNKMREDGKRPSQLHNNCSGKHTGMLAVAKALDVDTKGYIDRDHAVQKLVRSCVEEILGEELSEDRCGMDGCSIPTWAAPLSSFAKGFARMASGEGLSAETNQAIKRIFGAVTANPFLMRGTKSLDTDIMQAFGARLMVKVGADGVFCGALIDQGLGFALKIDDGNMDAAEVVVAKLLLAIAEPNAQERAALEARVEIAQFNYRKKEVAQLRAIDFAELLA